MYGTLIPYLYLFLFFVDVHVYVYMYMYMYVFCLCYFLFMFVFMYMWMFLLERGLKIAIKCVPGTSTRVQVYLVPGMCVRICICT